MHQCRECDSPATHHTSYWEADEYSGGDAYLCTPCAKQTADAHLLGGYNDCES